MKRLMPYIVTLLLLVVFADLVYLHYKLATLSSAQPSAHNNSNLENQAIQLEPNNNGSQTIVPQPVIDLITEATASLTQRVNAEVPIEAKTAVTPQAVLLVKEFYIPLGTGSTNSQDWVDLPGVEASVTPTNYGHIKEMYFEATLGIPNGTGRGYARIRNVTDNTPLIESEVYVEGTTTQLVYSAKLPIPAATRLYRVQLKSTLGTDIKLDNARLKIVVN